MHVCILFCRSVLKQFKIGVDLRLALRTNVSCDAFDVMATSSGKDQEKSRFLL